MGINPLKFEFPVSDFTVKASGFHYGKKFYLNNVKIFLDEKEMTKAVDLSYIIAFEHLAVEHANEHYQANVG